MKRGLLPHLASHLDPGAMVIDTGATVGDALATMLHANQELQFMWTAHDTCVVQDLLDHVERQNLNKSTRTFVDQVLSTD
ncbi:hypothetical protein ACS3SW_11950 [Roseobacteraceae bacterium S113]